MTDKHEHSLIVRRSDRPPRPAHERDGVFHHEVHIEGRLTGFWGAVAAIGLLLVLAVIFVLGLATITVILWIACGALLFGVVMAFFRAVTGSSKGRSPPDLRR